jgi:hypothetical protein
MKRNFSLEKIDKSLGRGLFQTRRTEKEGNGRQMIPGPLLSPVGPPIAKLPFNPTVVRSVDFTLRGNFGPEILSIRLGQQTDTLSVLAIS